jgi:hypothetical protein
MDRAKATGDEHAEALVVVAFHGCASEDDTQPRQSLDTDAASEAGDAGGSAGSSGSLGVEASFEECYWEYQQPGCGEQAEAVCVTGVGGGCVLAFCGCDGRTFQCGCGTCQVPFAALGECEARVDDAGSDAASE